MPLPHNFPQIDRLLDGAMHQWDAQRSADWWLFKVCHIDHGSFVFIGGSQSEKQDKSDWSLSVDAKMANNKPISEALSCVV